MPPISSQKSQSCPDHAFLQRVWTIAKRSFRIRSSPQNLAQLVTVIIIRGALKEF